MTTDCKIICSGNEEHYDYLIKREAFIAQNRTRSEIALGLQTEVEGTGKGFWCRNINRLYGNHAMEVQNPEHVVGKHNTHLEVLLRLTADEALFAPDPKHRNALYNLITEPHITIEPKFVDAYPAKNYLNLDVISNASHFLPVSGTSRRFFVPTVSPDRANDHEYFGKILAAAARRRLRGADVSSSARDRLAGFQCPRRAEDRGAGRAGGLLAQGRRFAGGDGLPRRCGAVSKWCRQSRRQRLPRH